MQTFVISVLIIFVAHQGVSYITEDECSSLCKCKHEFNSSKVQVAMCILNADDNLLECNVEWPMLFLTLRGYKFDSNSLVRCQRITRLHISSDSSLKVLRQDFFQHSGQLETLVVKAPIEMIESVFLRYMPSLHQLDIVETNLSVISRTIFEECPVSVRLRLSSNRISSLEDYSFKNCIYLITLDLGSNVLRKINLYTFEGAFNLEALDLSKNLIESIDDLSFKSLKKLKILSMNGNSLRSVKQHTFGYMEALTHLRLDSNKITYIASEAFKSLQSVQIINLSDNKLSILDLLLFRNLRHLKLTALNVECVQMREEDGAFVSVNVLVEFEKHPLCHGITRSSGNQKLVQGYSLVEQSHADSTQRPQETIAFLAIFERHSYLIPMLIGGLVVALVAVIVISVVCHVKNSKINQLLINEVQSPLMQSTL